MHTSATPPATSETSSPDATQLRTSRCTAARTTGNPGRNARAASPPDRPLKYPWAAIARYQS